MVNFLRINGNKGQSGQDATGTSFACDGRTTCPQMTSCDEAKFFQKNCPVEDMDGDLDGIPCESEWCLR
ncbi:MAG: excalibur calcium-binding domain-containing protein [Desulfoprunum sp.]